MLFFLKIQDNNEKVNANIVYYIPPLKSDAITAPLRGKIILNTFGLLLCGKKK